MSSHNPQQPPVWVPLPRVQGYPEAEYAPAQAPPQQNYTLLPDQKAYPSQDYAAPLPAEPPPQLADSPKIIYASLPPRSADYIPPPNNPAPNKSNTSCLDRCLQALCCCRSEKI